MKPKKIFGRGPQGTLTEAAEASSLGSTNAMLDGLFSNREKMHQAAKTQLSSLYATKDYYGRALKAGTPAKNLSKQLKGGK